ncbi:MAG: Ig-like domain-containing protein, partial [Actinobacteria bacterium]|nr:Ig-like domain-containing protein [Actinomycetota bacterium]
MRARDAAGNVDASPASYTWTVDTQAPAVTLTSPADGSVTNDETPTFAGAAGTASGDSATVTVKVYAGGSASGTPVQTLTTTRTGDSWSLEATTALADGTYTAHAEQDDAAGNVGRSGANTFTLDTEAPDTTPPAVTLTTPAHLSSVSDQTPTFAGAAGTASGDSATVTVKLYAGTSASGAPLDTMVTTRTGGSWSLEATSALVDGTYTAQAQQTDAAGNVGRSGANTFTLDTEAPETTLATTPPDPSASASASFSFSSPEAGASFQCQLDGAGFSACTSPQAYS